MAGPPAPAAPVDATPNPQVPDQIQRYMALMDQASPTQEERKRPRSAADKVLEDPLFVFTQAVTSSPQETKEAAALKLMATFYGTQEATKVCEAVDMLICQGLGCDLPDEVKTPMKAYLDKLSEITKDDLRKTIRNAQRDEHGEKILSKDDSRFCFEHIGCLTLIFLEHEILRLKKNDTFLFMPQYQVYQSIYKGFFATRGKKDNKQEGKQDEKPQRDKGKRKNSSLKTCYRCGEPGHLVASCPLPATTKCSKCQGPHVDRICKQVSKPAS
jgi:hypothetical protein